VTKFTDGEWHRLHPLTPLLKGGIAFIAIIAFILVNLRDILIESFLGDGRGGSDGEPLIWLAENGFVGIAVLAVLVFLVLFVVAFYVSWRMHTFRITDEVVEVRSGILFRTHRRGRLDRIQGINIARPFLPRLFGAAKLEVNVAGQDANVQLEYLGSAAADELRREILRLASGTQAVSPESVELAGSGTIIEQRVAEFIGPELDPTLVVEPQSVVKLHTGRLLGSLLLSGFTIFLIALVVGVAVGVSLTGSLGFLIPVIFGIIGTFRYYVTRFTKSLRYSIAGTPDGVRVGFGLLSTSNETLPPGRIHSVQVSQPIMWRIPGWWEIKVNRASTSSAAGAAGQANTTILPVGNITDVRNVLALVLPGVDPDLLATALVSKGGDDGFINSPKRARVLRWFSWRRNGFALTDSAVLLRKGQIWRELVIVPQARLQSVAVHQGPLLRRLSLAALHFHTVAGPITPALGAVDASIATQLFLNTADAAIRSSSADTSHRWRSGEALA